MSYNKLEISKNLEIIIQEIDNIIKELENEENILKRSYKEIKDEIYGIKKLSDSVKKKIVNITDEITDKIKKERYNIEIEIKNHRDDLIRKFDLRDKYMSELASTYISYCKEEIEDRLIEFKKFLYNKAKEFKDSVYNILKELIREIDEDIELNLTKYLTFSTEDLSKIKDKFLKKLESEFDLDSELDLDYDINIDFGTYFLVWGADRRKAIMAARELMREKLSDNIIMIPISTIYMKAEDYIIYAKEVIVPNLITHILTLLEDAVGRDKQILLTEIKNQIERYKATKANLIDLILLLKEGGHND